jgi:hypothetical protein
MLNGRNIRVKVEVREVKKEERRERKAVEKSRLYLDRLHPPAALSLGICGKHRTRSNNVACAS